MTLVVLKDDFTDADAMLTAHAAHHNALAALANIVHPLNSPYAVLPGSGFYNNFISQTGSNLSTVASVANRITFVPMTVPVPITASAICLALSSAHAGVTGVGGVYARNTTTGMPDTLVGSSGALTLTAVGAYPGAGVTLTPGVYWAATWFSAAATVLAAAVSALVPVFGTATYNASPAIGLTLTDTTVGDTGLPATITASELTGLAGASAPVLFLQNA